MMGYDPTKKQLAAINSRGKTLVTAAAGSGKTRVLTERIVSLILNGADIRDMMIATFTEAAATEMKYRIADALGRYRNNEKMRRQSDLVSAAQIGTYHNFCTRVLRENYMMAQLPYNFCVADGDYADTMQIRVVGDMLSEMIENDDEDLCSFISTYSKRFNKRTIADFILDTHKFISKMTDPEKWLDYAENMTETDYCRLTSSDAEQVKSEYRITMPFVKTLVRLVRLFVERYTAEKADNSVLDFDDLLHRTYELLKVKKIKYKYIFVDEYQDTNPIQDAIIMKISEQDVFIVGDKKQSIYRFNNADPDIFIEKEKEYSDRCLVMNENFRSSKEVIDAVNSVMSKCMTQFTGNIEYTNDEALVCMSGVQGEAKIFLGENSATNKIRGTQEARMITQKIQQLIGKQIPDGDTERPLVPGDIAVLYRSSNETVQILPEQLEKAGIPYNFVKDERIRESECAGLFMELLKVISSPDRDIPLLAVMRYPAQGFTDRELASVRIKYKKHAGNGSFSEACRKYAGEQRDQLAEKIKDLFKKIDSLRLYADSYSLPDFLFYAASEFNLYDYALMKSESEYKALCGLMDTITGCGERSLPMILKYMEDYKKKHKCYARIDSGLSGNAVSIITIHKSKGLEFPVVFVVGTDKKFNDSEYNKKNTVMLDNEFGIMPLVRKENLGKITSEDTVIRQVASQKSRQEQRAEELRLLYVAMTRARNMLYITSVCKSIDKQKDKWSEMSKDPRAVCGAESMLDFVMCSAVGGGLPEYEQYADDGMEIEKVAIPGKKIAVSRYDENWIIFDKPDMTKAKVSVSEIKQHDSCVVFKPAMFSGEDEITGAEFGSLVHSLMENVVRSGDTEKSLCRMEKNLLVTDAEKAELEMFREHIEVFLASELYSRIRISECVLTEQPFIVKKSADELGIGHGEIMVQGVIDLAYTENGSWVVVDYKTDHITDKNEEQLKKSYSVQLNLYADALEKITHRKVKEKLLYFLRADRVVEV